MATLHIEHAISDYGAWKAAFDRFAETRVNAGVRSHRIQQPVDDERYVLLDLEFDSTEAAEGFRTFLRNRVWVSRDASPALVGDPIARVLRTMEELARAPQH
jgi:hypothetical protein